MKSAFVSVFLVGSLALCAAETIDTVEFSEKAGYSNTMDVLSVSDGTIYSAMVSGCNNCDNPYVETIIRKIEPNGKKTSTLIQNVDIYKIAMDSKGRLLAAGEIWKKEKHAFVVLRLGDGTSWGILHELDNQDTTGGRAFDMCVIGDKIYASGDMRSIKEKRSWVVAESKDNGKSWSISDKISGSADLNEGAASIAINCDSSTGTVIASGYTSKSGKNSGLLRIKKGESAWANSIYLEKDFSSILSFKSVSFSQAGDIYAVARRQILESDKSGLFLFKKSPNAEAWSEIKIENPFEKGALTVYQLLVTSDSSIWLVGNHSVDGVGRWFAIRSDNAGKSWSVLDKYGADSELAQAVSICEDFEGNLIVGGNLRYANPKKFLAVLRRLTP